MRTVQKFCWPISPRPLDPVSERQREDNLPARSSTTGGFLFSIIASNRYQQP
jgi:hypothetical protein